MPQDEEAFYPFCPDETKYEKIAKIGEGSYGEVFKARDKRTKEFVALKKVLRMNGKDGFPISTLREIKILQCLSHENIVNLLDVCRGKATPNSRNPVFYLVFEFAQHDLAGLLRSSQVVLLLGQVKYLLQQLLNGLSYIHSNKIIHRDLKTDNILITQTGKLKVADFGLARSYSERRKRYSSCVATLWYRAPELILGEQNYTTAIDLWGVGCIMGEMWIRMPIMQGFSEQRQLYLISHLCGSITPDVWPGVEKLRLFNMIEMPQSVKRQVKERLQPYIENDHGLDLVDKLLCLDPKDRINVNEALDHPFFKTEPMPKDIVSMVSRLKGSLFKMTAPPIKRPSRSQILQERNNVRPASPPPPQEDPDQHPKKIS